MRFHGPNVIICEVMIGMSRTLIVGVYFPPSIMAHLLDIEDDLACFWGQYPIVLVDLNVDLDEDQNPRSQLVTNLLP